MIVSNKFELKREDLVKASRNALIFLGPALLVLGASVVDVVPGDWKYAALTLWVLNYLLDVLRKFLSVNKYK